MFSFVLSSLVFCPLKWSEKILNLAYVRPETTRQEDDNKWIWMSPLVPCPHVYVQRLMFALGLFLLTILCIVNSFHFFLSLHHYLLWFSQLWKSGIAVFVNYSICGLNFPAESDCYFFHRYNGNALTPSTKQRRRTTRTQALSSLISAR